MANRKAGSAGDESTGATKRSAGGRTGAANTTATGAGQATDGGAAGAGRKRAGGARGSTATATSGSATADTQATGGGAASKGASKTAGSAKGAAKGTSKTAGASKSSGGGATKSAAKGASKGGAKSAGGRGGGKADLRGDLRQFVNENPQGWGHEQWEGLLGRLRERGHDVSNPDDVGLQLERERLGSRLEGIEGVSAQKARSLVSRYGTVYSLWNADVDEIAREGKISREVAERIKSQLR